MARARNIKPGLFKNEILGEEDPLLSLLFIGLWCLADREGRLEDRPLRIKAEIFPYRQIDINGYLTVLERLEFIHRYSVKNVAYIQVLKFSEHQHPHKTEKPSIIPAKPIINNELKEVPLNNGALTVTKRPNTYRPNTDTLCSRKKINKERKSEYNPEFEDFWKIYPPNAASKKKTFESWQKALTNEEINHGDITRAAGAYRRYLERTDSTTAHATTWLNQERYTVEYEAIGANLGKHSTGIQGKAGARSGESKAEALNRIADQALEVYGITRENRAALESGQGGNITHSGNPQTMLPDLRELREGLKPVPNDNALLHEVSGGIPDKES